MLTVREAAALLQSWDNVLILTHIRPDGDTVGCAAALCAGLRAIGRTAYLLPNPGLTNTTRPYFTPYAAPEGFAPEKVVSADIATEELFPDNAQSYKGRVDLAIDHHPSFESFGRENIVRPDAAACGELLYDILAALGPITPEIALPLYVAVSTDCGCFAYANTTAHTHAVAAALLRTGIDYRTVNKTFFRTKTRVRMQLEAAMLREAEFYDKGRIVFLTVPLSLMESLSATESDAEELSSLGGQIEGVDCAVTARELKPDEWKISLRTGERVNATKVCQLYGGGGHAAAAGCTIKAPLEETRRRMLSGIAQVAAD
ncbi:MAG: DHH family phosphoesterase [Oscillibacter sp.]|nr:DHH family phosphoesterase [Oscillibacter sp.]